MTEKCDECGGSGKKKVRATSSGGTVTITCSTCKGTGKKPKNEKSQAARMSRFFIDKTFYSSIIK